MIFANRRAHAVDLGPLALACRWRGVLIGHQALRPGSLNSPYICQRWKATSEA